MKRKYEDLRSAKFLLPNNTLGHTQRERIKQLGYGDADFVGKPVIAVLSTWSEFNPCHIHFRERAEDVKRGIWQAGGVPFEIPVMSLGEPFIRPSAMLYRDLLSIEVEEVLRSHPVDGAVLMGGCDKTTPAMIMGATSINLPAIYLPAGPMLTGRWQGRTLGSGTDVHRAFNDFKTGKLDESDIKEMESAGARSAGHCMTMGTASTMTSIAESLGLSLPGSASIPAPDSRHRHMAAAVGRRAVEIVWENLCPRDILTEKAFENAGIVLMALGGSTNAIIHLIAMADRAGIKLELDRFEIFAAKMPVLANLKPSGEYLMEDFFHAGGLLALLERIRDALHTDAMSINGATLGSNIAGSQCFDDDVIRPLENPLLESGGLVVLRGNLAPDGCVLKRSASDPALHKHRGKAVVFSGRADVLERIDDPDLDVDANSVLVLKNAGPKGVPGMPEWGMLPIPAKLLKQGTKDMVRISDARMSGTHYGTVVLHITPESSVGGPLALVEDGDLIELDVAARQLNLLIDKAELDSRRAQWQPPEESMSRGWPLLYREHVGTASEGASLDFLTGVDDWIDPER